jgi:MoaA/NifB/PqqE/SkfB family radical SAM enzyme
MPASRSALPVLDLGDRPAIGQVGELYLEVTNRCNSLCTTCPLTFGGQEPKRDLSLAEIKRIVAGAPGLRRVVLHGVGEPLLNRELLPTIEWLKARSLHVLFNTNAIALGPGRADALLRSGLDELRVSIDGATRETYLALRGVDALDRVVANTRAFVARRDALALDRPPVHVFFTTTRTNVGELPALVEIAASIGAASVNVQRLVYWGEGLATAEQSLYRRVTEREQASLDAAAERARTLGLTLTASGGVAPTASLRGRVEPAATGCTRPWRLLYVTSHGSVLPCCFAPFTGVPFEQLVLGNALEQPLEEIWRDAPLIALRRGLRGSASLPACEGCGERWPY